MAEQASSRTAVRMPSGFMNANSDHATASHDDAVYAASSATTGTSTGQPEAIYMGMNRAYMTSEGTEAVRSAVGMRTAHGYYARTATMTPREREGATSIATASSTGQQHAHMQPSTNTSRDCWAAGGIRGTHGWVQPEALQVGSAAPPATRWVSLAWEPLVAGDEVEPPTAYPPVPARGEVPVTEGMTTTRGHLPPQLGQYSRQHLGVKRFRAPREEYNSIIDEQGVEAKRVGSPHRLIRRIPAMRGEGRREQLPERLAPEPWMPPSRTSGFILGVGAADKAARPGADHALPWAWAGAAQVTGPSTGRERPWGTNNSGLHETEGMGWQWNGSSEPDTTLQQRAHMPAQGTSSGGGAVYRPPAVPPRETRGTYRQREAESGAAESTPHHHHSLKVQRLSMGHIDTLSSSVESLGVASPGARAQSAQNCGALSDAMFRRAYSRRRQAYRQSTTANSTFVPTSAVVHQPMNAGVVQTRNIGPTERGGWMSSGHGASISRADCVGVESKTGGEDGSFVSSGGASRAASGHHTPTSTVQRSAGTPSVTLRMPADSSTPSQPTALPTSPCINSELATAVWAARRVAAGNSVTANAKGALGTMDVENSATTSCCSCAPEAASSNCVSRGRTASPLGRALQGGKGAPGYDAAVSTAGCGVAGESGEVEAFSSGVGDVDDDSSDGGAAHEEISAWLHSTADWWTS